MSRSRAFVLAAAAAMLAATVVAAPSAAASPRLAIVQGIPGKVVDVCIGNKEVKSGLKYGKWFQRSIPAGDRTLRFRTAAPGTCTGSLLASRSRTLVADDDLTIVATAQAPKVLVFDNTELGVLEPPIGGSYWAFRHAADLGEVTFKGTTSFSPVTPAADPVWTKGMESWSGIPGNSPIAVVVTRPDSPTVIVGTVSQFGDAVEVTRLERILVGRTELTARLVTIVRGLLES